jgi:hypothetical protein
MKNLIKNSKVMITSERYCIEKKAPIGKIEKNIIIEVNM